jgi:GNAT superfamily N-acetyltransferase
MTPTMLNEGRAVSRGAAGRQTADFTLAIDDQRASELYDSFDAASPLEQEQYRSALRNWAETKLAEEQSRNYDDLTGIYADVNSWWSDSGGGKADDEVKYGAANRKFIAAQTGQTAREMGDLYPSERDRWFLQTFGQAPKTESEAYQTIGKLLQTRQQTKQALRELPSTLALNLMRPAATGTDAPELASLDLFNAWKERHADILQDLPEDWESRAMEQAEEIRQSTTDLMREIGPDAKKAWDILQKWSRPEANDAGVTDQSSVIRQDVEDLAKNLTNMPKDRQDRLFEALYRAAEATGAGMGKGFFEKVGEGLVRGGVKLYDDNVMGAEDRALRLNVTRLQRGGTLYEMADGTVGTQEEIARWASTGNYNATKLLADPSFQAGTGNVSDERRRELLDSNEQRLREMQTLRKVRQLAEGAIDPLKTELDGLAGSLVQGAYTFSQSAAYTAMAAIPYVGLPAVVYSLGNSNYFRMLDEYPDMDTDFAWTLSMAIGAPQAVVERFKANALLGKSPALNALMKKMTDARVPLAARIGVAYGANVAYQTGQEFIQEAMPVLGDQMAAAIREDMPQFDAAEAWGAYIDQTPEIFFSMLWAGLIGGGVVTLREFKRDGIFLTNVGELEMVGVVGETARDIAAEQDLDVQNEKLKTALNNRRPEDIQAGIAKRAAALEAAGKQQGRELPTRHTATDADGNLTHIIYDQQGKELLRTADTLAADVAYVGMVRQIIGAEFSQDAYNVQQFANWWATQDPKQASNDLRDARLPNQGITAERKVQILEQVGNKQGIEELHRRIAQSPYAGTPYDQIVILGEASVEQVGDMVFRSVMTVYPKGDLRAAREEMHHTAVRFAAANGRADENTLRGWLEASERVFAESGLDIALPRADMTDIVESMAVVQEAFENERISADVEMSLPQEFVAYIKRMIQVFVEVLKRGKALREAFDAGALPSDFEAFLAETTGVADQTVVDRSREKTAQEVAPEMANYSIGVTSQQDADYLAAVERGDMEMAQRMVDEAARAAGYGIGPVWHGTQSGEFEMFLDEKSGGRGFYFAKKKEYAGMYAKGDSSRIITAYLNLQNPISSKQFLDYGKQGGLSKAEAVEQAKKDGFDGIDSEGAFVAFYANQIKSADPVTRDSQGNVIPLSQRFDATTGNINYSIGSAAQLAAQNAEMAKEIQRKADAVVAADQEAEDVFFTQFWPKMLKKAGLNLKPTKANLTKAAEYTMPELLEWLKDNPQYLDYYHKDWDLTKTLLQAVYPNMTDDQFIAFRLFTGITSPNTKLRSNMADAVQLFDLWMREGSIKSMEWEWSAKGNRKVKTGPFMFSGTTGAGKTYAAHVLEDIFQELGSWQAVLDHLYEAVTVKEINAYRNQRGWATGIEVGKVKEVVKAATGQSNLIPRMFIFGPKVGAYTLNTSGDDRFTTTDIWEGRFIRSHFPSMFETADGLPVSVEENRIFQEFSQAFNEVFQKMTGLNLPPSALQAVRWFFMLNHAKKAGYRYASTDDTISGYAAQAIRGKLGFDLGVAGQGGRGSGQAGDGAGSQAGAVSNYSIASGDNPLVQQAEAEAEKNVEELSGKQRERQARVAIRANYVGEDGLFDLKRAQDYYREQQAIVREQQATAPVGEWYADKEVAYAAYKSVRQIQRDLDEYRNYTNETGKTDLYLTEQPDPVITQDVLDERKGRLPKHKAEVQPRMEALTGKLSEDTFLVSIENGKGKQAGRATVRISPDYENTLYVNETEVYVEFRNKGFGEALYREIAKFAQSRGLTEIRSDQVSPAAARVRFKLFSEKEAPDYFPYDYRDKTRDATTGPPMISMVDLAASYSISTQSEIDRVQAAMDRLARSPSERISQYAALKERLTAALERNKPIMQSMRGDTLPQDFDRTRILNDLGFLDYILKVLPPEVRGRVGGYTNLASIAPVDVYKGDQKVSEAKNPAGAIISAWMREGQNIGQAQKNTALPEGYSTVPNTTDERRDKTIANFLIDRLKKIDRELERYYKRDLMERIFDVLDKSRPKAGQSGVKRSTLGAETQKFADMVYRSSLLDDEKTAERLAAIEAQITSTEATADSQKRISELSEEWTIVNTFGDLKRRPSETLAYGLEWLQTQLKAGREAWQIKEAARIQENRERAAKVIAFLGKPTDFGRFENKSALQRFLQAVNAFDLDHKSFEQFAPYLFGDEVAAELSKKMQRAQIDEAKLELENTRSILAALRQGAKAAGMSTSKALVAFKENQPYAVRKMEGRKVKDTKISIELAKKIVRGLADRGSLSNQDVQTLSDELAALPRDTKKEFVTIKQVIFRGEEVRLTMSRAQAMQLWLTWQQSDAQEKMRADGFTDDSFDDLDNLISGPFAQAILRVTSRIYGSGYALTNPIYARMFGMNMPMVRNYAPARYLSSKEVKDVGLDGSPLTAGGQPSFAKSRVNHTAKLAPEDALTVLQSHIAMQSHWVAFAEVTREYRSLLSNPDVRESIRQRLGADVLRTAEMWGDQMEQRGGNKGREIAWINNMLGAVIGGQSVSLLGYNLKSLMMQTDNLMRFTLALDSRQIGSALSDPVALMQNVRKVWKTDIIQTRLEGGATAETRFFFERFVSMFRRGAKVAEMSMMPMNYLDSAGLSISGAIVYQAAYKDALDSGIDPTSAERAAKDAVEAMVYRYGQPVLMGQKSNIENSGNAFTKAFFLFMSDPRLKMAIISDSVRGLATGRGDWKTHVRRIVAIEMMAVVSHVLATAFRDATSDDDDEDLWSMGGFARALLLAPFQGYFLLGSVSDLVLSRLTEAQWFTPTQNPLIRTADTALRAFNNLDDAFNFDDPDALVKEWTNITRSIAVMPPLAAPAVIMNIVRPLVQGWERMDDDE